MSSSSAKASIQAAIDAANDGDSVAVAKGTYDPIYTANTVGKTKKALSLRANLWFDKKNTHEEGVGSAVFVP